MGKTNFLFNIFTKKSNESKKSKFVEMSSDNKGVSVDPWGIDFSGYIEGVSENGIYHFATGTYRKENASENSIDPDTEGYIGFTKDKVLFKNRFDGAIDYCHISNQGLFVFYTDECKLIIRNLNGDTIIKKNVGIDLPDDKGQYEFDERLCYIYGDSNGEKVLWFLDIGKQKSWIKKYDFEKLFEMEDTKVGINNDIVTVKFNDSLRIDYSIDGHEINKKQTEQIREALTYGSTYYKKAMEIIESHNASFTNKEVLEIDKLFQLAISKKDCNLAPAYRSYGEFKLKIGDKKSAIDLFEKALDKNPKIGIKRLHDDLIKEINHI